MAKLFFNYSVMNAGKTMALLQANHNYLERSAQTCLFTSCLDNRDRKGLISSRIGISAEANLFDQDTNLFNFVVDFCLNASCVFVDEAQFLNKEQVQQLEKIVDELNIPVLTYGLRTDFRGEPFEGSKYLLARADVIHEVRSVCFCGSLATMVARYDSNGFAVTDGDSVLIGAESNYCSLCRKHYMHAVNKGMKIEGLKINDLS
ncbi:thymidine kinase [Photobacterium kishitanii]|uniref:Thymidine kinase n=1 Tax=Photobacterium kishitanii TaxID=318456 RepID=A0A2T3KMM1_9GAMM|nr:thymidine kinase [Photobacterium kishitanii]PSV01046.1 thymidine kinase [Photobacterium kishitanii]